MRVLLTGYYGKANFGDDVLLKVTHGLVRQWQPEAEIAILCDQYLDDYLPDLLGERLRILQPGDREHFDLIIHGGGGTFFDFGNYGYVNRILNQSIKLAGFANYALFDKLVRAVLGKPRISAKERLGWGVGVGTYATGSNKLRKNIPTIVDFDMLVVRDAASIDNLQCLGFADHAILGSDLAFLENYWLPASTREVEVSPKNRPCLGLILRDWPKGPSKHYLERFAELLPELDRRYALSLFVFDKRVDDQLLALAEPYTTHIWSPPATKFDEFCSFLAKQDVVISSRAHGAICGAVMGIPSILVELEPKLRTVNDMLPHATRLLQPDVLDLPLLISSIDDLLAIDPCVIAEDVARNKGLIKECVERTLCTDE